MADDHKYGVDYISFLLVGIGSLVWGGISIGLIASGDPVTALTDWNLVHQIGQLIGGSVGTAVATAVYGLVGIAGILDLLGVTGGYGLFSDDRSMVERSRY